MNQSTAGIDVGKRELDVSVDGDRARRFANTSAGVAELVGWLGSQGPLLAVCEATGGYEALVVQALRQVGVPVHIAHPDQVRAFARACGYQAKTDGLDAMVLSRYGQVFQPVPTLAQEADRGQLQDLLSCAAVGLGVLLYEGIGDTIRVSLSGDSVEEVTAGYEILKSLNLRDKGTTLVACPSCGRADVDVVKLANDVDALVKRSDKKIKVAVMGCEVNGPGEAKDADVGIAAGAGRAIIFRKGEKVREVPEAEMLTALMEEIENTPAHT